VLTQGRTTVQNLKFFVKKKLKKKLRFFSYVTLFVVRLRTLKKIKKIVNEFLPANNFSKNTKKMDLFLLSLSKKNK